MTTAVLPRQADGFAVPGDGGTDQRIPPSVPERGEAPQGPGGGGRPPAQKKQVRKRARP